MPGDNAARLKGIFNITVTPFQPDGSLDLQTLGNDIERIISFGFDGLLIGGTYGEFPTMSVEERTQLFRRSMDAANGRVPVMLCTASSDPQVTLALTRYAAELGGYPMVTAPYVTEVTDEQIFSYFNWIAPETKGRMIIYNAPGIGITLSASLIERLASIPGAAGLKQGDLNVSTIDTIANRVGGRMKLFCASDLAFLGPVMVGFDGVSSTNSCAFPEIILSTYRAISSGDAAAARQLHQSWYPFRELARKIGQPQTTKAAMMVRGWGNACVRPPLQQLTRAQMAEVTAVTQDILSNSQDIKSKTARG